jgi:hypothetical protein
MPILARVFGNGYHYDALATHKRTQLSPTPFPAFKFAPIESEVERLSILTAKEALSMCKRLGLTPTAQRKVPALTALIAAGFTLLDLDSVHKQVCLLSLCSWHFSSKHRPITIFQADCRLCKQPHGESVRQCWEATFQKVCDDQAKLFEPFQSAQLPIEADKAWATVLEEIRQKPPPTLAPFHLLKYGSEIAVKQSKIPATGGGPMLGLFVLKPVRKGEYITGYPGKIDRHPRST